MNGDWEPLLPDDRVAKIAQTVRLMYPTLPHETQFLTFIIPEHQNVPRDRISQAPHERGCLWVMDHNIDCSCDPLTIPDQAIFAVEAPNPHRRYKGKNELVTSAMPLVTWRAVEKRNSHYVSSREDPAFGPLAIAAKGLADRLQNLRELI